MYPELSVEEAYIKFIDEVFDIVRIDGNDPVENWRQHIANLSVYAQKLQQKNYHALHYVSEGTDLTVGLAKIISGKMLQVMLTARNKLLLLIYQLKKYLQHQIEIE